MVPPNAPEIPDSDDGLEDSWVNIEEPEKKLLSSDFGLPGNNEVFKLKNHYLWSNYEVELPVKIDFTFTFQTPGEIHPCFSLNKKQWG